MRLPDDSVQVNPGAGRATYKASEIEIGDYGSLDNSFNGLPGVPATVSFEVHWSGVGKRLRVARYGTERRLLLAVVSARTSSKTCA